MGWMWRDGRRVLLALPAAVLILCSIGLYWTRGAMANLSFLKSSNTELVDTRSWQTVQALAPLAVTAEEQTLAQNAVRLADHEVDQAFQLAMRIATAKATRPAAGPAVALTQDVAAREATVKADQAKVDALTAPAKAVAGGASANGAGNVAPSGQDADSDDLERAKTQLQLDQDVLADAKEKLAEVSGDKRAEIQQELAAHQAAVKKAGVVSGGETALVAARTHSTLYLQVKAWMDQRSRMALLLQARQKAQTDAAALTKAHAAVESQASSAAKDASASLQDTDEGSDQDAAAGEEAAAGAPAVASAPASTAAKTPVVPAKPLTRAERLQLLSDLSSEHALLDDQLETQQQLVTVYAKWAEQVERQHQIVIHMMLRSTAMIAFILLCAVVAAGICQYVLDAPERAAVKSKTAAEKPESAGKAELVKTPVVVAKAAMDVAPEVVIDGARPVVLAKTVEADQRRMQTLHTILNLAIEVVAAALVMLVIFGPPSQIPTILGLATAGVTVVFQDFILAFFGWFILMGKNGITVGDWVEINSVGGEVVEIGLFRTALLETGNWTDKGHPTGRRVTFINNFAITGQYFNFSTVGQWMWDEITVNIPPGEDTYATIEEIHKRVIEETTDASRLAENEWKRVTRKQGMSRFTAEPSVDLRPAASGIDIIVRYVTRASGRFAMRNKLYQAVIELLRKKPAELATGSASSVEGSVKPV